MIRGMICTRATPSEALVSYPGSFFASAAILSATVLIEYVLTGLGYSASNFVSESSLFLSSSCISVTRDWNTSRYERNVSSS